MSPYIYQALMQDRVESLRRAAQPRRTRPARVPALLAMLGRGHYRAAPRIV
jgi:hypothetical protein